MARKWNIVIDQSNANNDVGNEITCNTEVLKSNICHYNDAYILVWRDITIIGHRVTQVVFQSCAPFTKCITKIDRTTKYDTKDLIMPKYNLLECSSNYSDTTGSLWFYSKDEATNFNAEIRNNSAFKSVQHKAKLLEDIIANGNNGILENEAIAVPLKYLSTVWKSLEMSLINFKVELKLKWKKYCVLSATGVDNASANSNDFIFTIKDKKLYVPVVTLSAKENQKLLKFPSKGFERSEY